MTLEIAAPSVPKVEIPQPLETRIRNWNLTRNGLKFNLDLETQMLSEEAREFYVAQTLVDRLDAFIDFQFVFIGTIYKFNATKHENYDEFASVLDGMDTLSSWATHVMSEMVEQLSTELMSYCPALLYQEAGISEILTEALEIVVSANEQKGTELDENGKVKKPKGFVKPEERLDRMLKKHLGTKYSPTYGGLMVVN